MSAELRPAPTVEDGIVRDDQPLATPGESPGRRTARAFVRNPLGVFGVVVLIGMVLTALFAPLIAEYPSGYGVDVLSPPSAEHWFGTDSLGRDIFAQVVWGARTSLMIGGAASAMAIAVGVAVGVAAAYFKRVETALGVLVDVTLSLPVLPLMILIAALAGPSTWTLAVVIALFSWPEVARVVRSQALSIVGLPYVEAGALAGGSHLWIIRRHLVPAVAPVITVSVVLTASRAVLSESGLAFLGLGDPNGWSWGTILHNAQRSGTLGTAWWTAAMPSLAILLLVVAATLVSLAYNDARNPRTRED